MVLNTATQPPFDPPKAADIVIVGAGPAGATLARLLGATFSVVLVDSRNLSSCIPPDPRTGEGIDGMEPPCREKCCGGLLAPDAQALLARLGVELPAFVRENGQPLAVRALDLPSGLSRRYPRAYINLRRPLFERWLLSLLPPESIFLPETRFAGAAPTTLPQGWEVRLRQGPEERRLACRVLVGADGAASAVRRLLGKAPLPATRYLAVQERFRLSPGMAGTGEYTAFFDPALTDFYGWVIPKHEELLLGLALPVAGAPAASPPTGMPEGPGQRLERARRLLEKRGYHFPGQGRRSGCLLLRPGPGDIFPGRDGAYCIGEAAGWISPSSAEGFSYAFASALALARAIAGAPSPERALAAYCRNTLTLRANIAWKQAKSLAMFTPRLRRMIMRSGLLTG